MGNQRKMLLVRHERLRNKKDKNRGKKKKEETTLVVNDDNVVTGNDQLYYLNDVKVSQDYDVPHNVKDVESNLMKTLSSNDLVEVKPPVGVEKESSFHSNGENAQH